MKLPYSSICFSNCLVISLTIISGQVLKYMDIGNYVEENVSSLKHFMSQGGDAKEYSIPSLVALSSAMRLLQRYSSLVN